jgi:hypothetical protein
MLFLLHTARGLLKDERRAADILLNFDARIAIEILRGYSRYIDRGQRLPVCAGTFKVCSCQGVPAA